MKELLFIYNPKAGKAGIANCLSDVLDIFSRAGYEITVYPTKCHGDGEAKARERSDRFERIICSGGDGTLDEIVTGVLESGRKIPIGYIPAGSTNDFARSLGIPRDMRSAARIAVSDNYFASDIGRFNSKYFVYVAAFGLFTDVTYETDQNLKNVLGYAAYVAEAVKRLQSINSIPLTIEYDDQVLRGDFLVGMVSNSTSVGGIKALTGPDVELNDGLFEVLLVKAPDNVIELNKIPPAILDRRIKSDCVIYFRCKEITFKADEPIAWTLDGEYGGAVGVAQISNLRNEIEFVVPTE